MIAVGRESYWISLAECSARSWQALLELKRLPVSLLRVAKLSQHLLSALHLFNPRGMGVVDTCKVQLSTFLANSVARGWGHAPPSASSRLRECSFRFLPELRPGPVSDVGVSLFGLLPDPWTLSWAQIRIGEPGVASRARCSFWNVKAKLVFDFLCIGYSLSIMGWACLQAVPFN